MSGDVPYLISMKADAARRVLEESGFRGVERLTRPPRASAGAVEGDLRVVRVRRLDKDAVELTLCPEVPPIPGH